MEYRQSASCVDPTPDFQRGARPPRAQSGAPPSPDNRDARSRLEREGLTWKKQKEPRNTRTTRKPKGLEEEINSPSR